MRRSVTARGRYIALLIGLWSLMWVGCSAQPLPSHGRFQHIEVFQPDAAPRGVVLLLSGDRGSDRAAKTLARSFADQGALVALLNTPSVAASFTRDPGCATLDGDLDNLGRYLEAAYKMPDYRPPILAGIGRGATLAFAAIAQASDNAFAGGMAFECSPDLGLPFRPCRTGALAIRKTHGGYDVQAADTATAVVRSRRSILRG